MSLQVQSVSPVVDPQQEQFDAAVASCKTWNPSTAPSNEDKLALYGLFKQATIGDNNTPQPGFLALTVCPFFKICWILMSLFEQEKAKWNAWNSRKGLSKEEAMKKYIEELEAQKKRLN